MNELKRKYEQEFLEDDLLILKENQEYNETKRANYLSYTERYFKRYYRLNVKVKRNDHLILLHSNKVAVCSLAPTHPLLNKEKYKVEKIEFIQFVNDEMRGKHKHFANNLNFDQPLCKIIATNLKPDENETDTISFMIYSSLNAKLVEINEKLFEQPELIQDKPNEGYLAILLPKLDNINTQLSKLITHVEYLNETEQLKKAY